jgi:membrane fusion protein, multidrug efflux system
MRNILFSKKTLSWKVLPFGKDLGWVFVSCTFLLFACGEKQADTSTLEGKKAHLAALKDKSTKLKDEIATLEAAIEKEDVNAKKERITAVTTTALLPENFTHSIDIQGTVKSEDEQMITPKGMGTITKVLVKAGDFVKAGQAVGYLDDAVMKQSISQVETQLNFAKQNFEKLDRLWKQGIGTEVQLLGAKTQVEALEKQIATMQEQNSGAVVRAPRSGTIDEVYAKAGMPGAPGAPFAKLVNKSGLKVQADIAEGYAGKIRKGNSVVLNFPDIKKEIKASVGYVSQTINPLNRTYRVDIPIAGTDYIPNMISVIRVIDYQKAGAIVVPINTIQKSESGEYVMVAENGVAKKVMVKVGQTYNDKAEIISGLKAGANLITVGFQELNDGDKVK